MKISLSILTRPYGKKGVRSPRLAELERRLRTLRDRRESGTTAIDLFVSWYLGDFAAIMADIASAGRGDRLRAFSLSELTGHLLEMVNRKAEGTAVIDEFFALYVLEPT